MKCIETEASIEAINPLSDSIIQLILRPNQFIDYYAGQYLQVYAEDFLSFSIANAPLGAHVYELHIRHEKNPYQLPLFAKIKKEGKLLIRLPLGDCYLEKLSPHLPIIFIAGGTGFAPVKAMIEQLLATSDQRTFELFWGARSQSDLYLDEKVSEWQTKVSHFQYYSLLPKTNGRQDLSELVYIKHQMDLKKHQVVIAGPFDMVYEIRDRLVAYGLNQEQIFSDAFSFEPKE